MSDKPAPPYYHVGSNVPGYLSESEPTCVDSAEQARDVLIDNLRNAQDALPECERVDELTDGCGCEPCALWQAARDTVQTLTAPGSTVDMSQGYSVDVNIGRSLPIRHWVERFDATEFDHHTECNPDA